MGNTGTDVAAAITPAPTLDELLLLRLALAKTPPAAGDTYSKVAGDLAPLLRAGADAASSWRERFAAAVARRLAAGEITVPRRGRLVLTEVGRAAVAAAFGEVVAAEPGKASSWTAVRDGLLVARALGRGDNGETTRRADALRAAILLRQHAPDVLTAAAGSPPPTLNAVVNLLATRAVRARRGTPAELRAALLRGWLAAGVAPEPADDGAGAGNEGGALPAFAAAALDAARRCPASARMGEHKVFVGAVFEEWSRQGDDRGDGRDLTTFKRRLAQANECGLLRLSRADLAGTHAPALFAASEVRSLGATFHLIRLD